MYLLDFQNEFVLSELAYIDLIFAMADFSKMIQLLVFPTLLSTYLKLFAFCT